MSARPSSTQRGYDSRWQRARAGYLRSHPLCAMCTSLGRTTAASVVDHVRPHRGDAALFWDRNNWQALCAHCHDSHKQRIERTGTTTPGADVSGMPLDGAHPWNCKK